MPYLRSRHTQRLVCTIRGTKSGNDLVIAELTDTKGNETLDNISREVAAGSGDDSTEKTGLLDKPKIWSYIILFDYTRPETYEYAKTLIETIRKRTRSQHSSSKEPAIIFLIGNKKEMCAAASLSLWIKYQRTLQILIVSSLPGAL